MITPLIGSTGTLFIPRVEPVFKKWRGEDAFGHAAASSSSQLQRAGASADPSLASMRGREEEGASDESVTALHMAFMNCSDAVDRFTLFSRKNGRGAAVDSGGKEQHPSLTVKKAFETLDSAFCHFLDHFAPILQLTLCDAEATEDAFVNAALAKKVSPESAGYNQQAKPALGSLLSVLVFLSSLHSNHDNEGEGGSAESHPIELFLRELAKRSFEKFLKHAFGRHEGREGNTDSGNGDDGHTCTNNEKIIRLARFAFWLCNALEAGALWLTVSRKSNANKEKKAVEELSHENVEETAAKVFACDVRGDDVAGSQSIEGIIGNFLAKAAVVVQTPICVQLQRYELLSFIASVDREWRRGEEDEEGHHDVHTHDKSSDAHLHIGLLSRVCGFLLGHAGAEHHQHNARRNIAAWRHLARMLRHFRRSLACKKAFSASPHKLSDATGEQCRQYDSISFIEYLDERVITAFERRDRGVAAMANLFRRQLESALVSYTGATMESLGLKETASSASESANGSFAVAGAATNGNTQQSAPANGSFPHLPSNIEPKIHHQQGFHDRARKMAVSRPSSDELSAAKNVVIEAFFWPEQPTTELFDSASAHAFLEVVATFWLRPPCVAAA